MTTVAITDWTFSALDIEQALLDAAGCQLASKQCDSESQLIELVGSADAVITQFAPITAEVIAAMTQAKVIVRYGIGVDNVDLDAAAARGIPVSNVPDYCIDEVADHTLAFILSATRQLLANCLHIRTGNWGLATGVDDMKTLRDLTVGYVGFGRIGREVLDRLRAFKCTRLVHDPHVDDARIREAGCTPVPLDQLLAESDIVTLHCPSTPETRYLLDQSAFSHLKPGAIIINLARGDLIHTDALIEALESGQVGAAAVDVCDPEPIPEDSPLRSLPNVLATSHIASASRKAVTALR
ncbi:MAG: C-terminal binding protein, partial [Planctomycetaceae bacterium]